MERWKDVQLTEENKRKSKYTTQSRALCLQGWQGTLLTVSDAPQIHKQEQGIIDSAYEKRDRKGNKTIVKNHLSLEPRNMNKIRS